LKQDLTPQNPVVNDGPGRIDSVQNGLLLNALFHRLWDSWLLINPVLPVVLIIDDQWNYRVTYIGNDGLTQAHFDGRIIQFNANSDLPALP
jgi:HNH endonuclease